MTHTDSPWHVHNFNLFASHFPRGSAVLIDSEVLEPRNQGAWGISEHDRVVWQYTRDSVGSAIPLFSPFRDPWKPCFNVGNTIIPLLHFARERAWPNVMLMEYDTVYRGDVKSLVERCSRFDFAAPRYGPVQQGWMWKKCIRDPRGKFPLKQPYRSLNCFSWYTGKALEFLWKQYTAGWTGHFEIVVASLLTWNGFKCDGLKGFHTDVSYNVGKSKPTNMTFGANTLYHPIRFEKHVRATYGAWKPEFAPKREDTDEMMTMIREPPSPRSELKDEFPTDDS